MGVAFDAVLRRLLRPPNGLELCRPAQAGRLIRMARQAGRPGKLQQEAQPAGLASARCYAQWSTAAHFSYIKPERNQRKPSHSQIATTFRRHR